MLKKYLLTIIFGVVSLLFAVQVQAESIQVFDSRIQILPDGTIQVQENINYDFGDLQRHGIFRDIALKSSGVSPKLVIDQVTVDNGQGENLPFHLTSTNNQLEIKIGDANKFVTGKQLYRIGYRVNGALGSFTDHDELYWNVTGNGWPVSIDQASAIILLPTAQPARNLQLYCYAGPSGSKTQCQQAHLDLLDIDSAESATFSQTQLLAAQGLTVDFAWPKGLTVITPVTARPDNSNQMDLFSPATIRENSWVLIFPFITLILMFWWWFRKGRGPRARGAVVPQYEPWPDLSPGETGIIYRGGMSNKSLVAELIELARTGYLKITYSKKVIRFAPDEEEFTLERLKDSDSLPLGFPRSLLETLFAERSWVEENLSSLSLFGFIGLIAKASKLTANKPEDLNQPTGDLKNKVTLSELKASFIVKKNISLLLLEPKRQLISRGYFQTKSSKWFFPIIVFAFLFFTVAKIFLYNFSFLSLSIIISTVIIIIFLSLRSSLTAKGAEAKEYIKGLKMYLEVAEKDRLKFHDAPQKNPETFELLLPYAIALGVEKEWAEKFKDLSLPSPDWYSDSSGGAFNAVIFANGLHNFSSAFGCSSAMGGSSGLGGGGFSGGGGGGGGGGSW